MKFAVQSWLVGEAAGIFQSGMPATSKSAQEDTTMKNSVRFLLAALLGVSLSAGCAADVSHRGPIRGEATVQGESSQSSSQNKQSGSASGSVSGSGSGSVSGAGSASGSGGVSGTVR
jgi:hypothetical protein